MAAVGANLQVRQPRSTLPQIQWDNKTDEKWQKQRLPLEIIEHDGVRHDLAEAGHRVELSDDLCAQTARIKNQ